MYSIYIYIYIYRCNRPEHKTTHSCFNVSTFRKFFWKRFRIHRGGRRSGRQPRLFCIHRLKSIKAIFIPDQIAYWIAYSDWPIRTTLQPCRQVPVRWPVTRSRCANGLWNKLPLDGSPRKKICNIALQLRKTLHFRLHMRHCAVSRAHARQLCKQHTTASRWSLSSWSLHWIRKVWR